MFPSKLLLGKDMPTLTLVDLEYKTSVSIWELQIMIVHNDSYSFILALYSIKFTEHKLNCRY